MFAHLRFVLITSSLLLFYAFSCKTAEQIEREQTVERMNSELKATQMNNAELVSKVKQLEENVGTVTGKFEEKDYEKRKVLFSEMRKLETKILVLEDNNKTLTEEIQKIQAGQAEQKKFLDKVLSTLSSMGGISPNKSESKKDVKKNAYDEAMELYGKGKYASSKVILLDLVNNQKGEKLARVYHNLGMIAYMDKNDDEALVFFSKLYSGNPTSTFAPNGLIYMSKSLNRMGKKAEAKEALNEVIKNFPKHKKATEARGLLAKL